MLLLLIITGGHTHLIMDIHLTDIMEIPDIMATGTIHIIMATETIHIMGIDLTVIRIANMAEE